jgi:hypothetical protein
VFQKTKTKKDVRTTVSELCTYLRALRAFYATADGDNKLNSGKKPRVSFSMGFLVCLRLKTNTKQKNETGYRNYTVSALTTSFHAADNFGLPPAWLGFPAPLRRGFPRADELSAREMGSCKF